MVFEGIVKKLQDEKTSLPLNHYVERRAGILPELGGIYAFWWKNETDEEKQLLRSFNRRVFIKGKQIKPKREEIPPEHIIHEVNWDWNLEESFVCLYVGKASNIAKRVKQHLGMGHGQNWYELTNHANYKASKAAKYKNGFLLKWDTACQLRAGMEHLLSSGDGTYQFKDALQKNIYFSHFTDFDKDPHIAMTERFYSEDFAIGSLRPWFNVDSER